VRTVGLAIGIRMRRRTTTLPASTASVDEEQSRAVFDRVAPFTVGAEEEYLLVDPDTLDPAPVAQDALACAGDGSHLAPEFRAGQIEAITAPCATIAEVAHELASARLAVVDAVGGRALVVACGAHPTALDPGPVTALPRYLRLAQAHPWAAQHAFTCGLHVHVALSGADRALAVHNALRSYLPEIVALGANAPFHRGEDSGLATVRPKLNSAWPRFGIPPAFASWRDVMALGAWAREGGAFPDETYQWWDLRLRPGIGTVEVRAPDVQTRVEDAATVTALVQSLVYELASRHDAGERLPIDPHERIQENLWLALRDGVSGRLIDLASGRSGWTGERLLALAERLLPSAAILGCDRELLGIGRIVLEGGGAERQRNIVVDGGTAALVRALADETHGDASSRRATAKL